MEAKREPMFYVAVGRKGIGKTYQSIRLIDAYKVGNIAVGLKPRKVLLFDVNNEYTKYKTISADPKSILQFSVHPLIECRRVSAYKPNGKIKSDVDFQEDMRNILENFRGGLLVLEDLSLFVGDALSTKLVGSLCTHRHKDIDIITHFQSIAKSAHPKFKALTSIVRLHKTTDTCSRSSVRKNLGDDYSKVRIGELIVNNRFNIGLNEILRLRQKKVSPISKEYQYYDNNYNRFFLHIDYDNHKIMGNFTQSEFIDACKKYLQEETKTEITPLLNYKDEKSGKKKYTFQQAFDYKLRELYQFYGS